MISHNELFEYMEGPPFFDLFKGTNYPWEGLNNIVNFINQFIQQAKAKEKLPGEIFWASLSDVQQKMVYVEKPVLISEDIFIKDYEIYIGKGTYLEPTAIIKSPAVVGKNCEIRQGAYIRGNVFIGNHTVIGHTTEIKNSVVMNHSEAGHFSYIGDSIIGNHVNLGAGTKIANLQFRTVDEKISGNIRKIILKHEGKITATGMTKLGAIIGDGAELGCNSVTCPCVILGKNAAVYPCSRVNKGFYPSRSVIKNF